MWGWFSDEIARASRSKRSLNCSLSDLDGDGAAQSRVDRPKDLAHPALAELAFDTVGPQARAHSQSGESRILQQLRGVLDGRPIQEFAAWLCEQRLYFAAQFGIGFGQQRRALLDGSLASRMVELFNSPEMLRGNIVRVTIVGTYSVNLDCTGTMALNVSPLGLPVDADFVIVRDGAEFRAIGTDPGVGTA